MPAISRFYGIVIYMYYADHAPPHFHACYGTEEALISIQALRVIQGSLPKQALRMVLDWANMHQAELMADWELCVAKQVPNAIAPLE
jgi:hypothetical protein